jgi:hypothetical protein
VASATQGPLGKNGGTGKAETAEGEKVENNEAVTRIISKLDLWAVPMDVRGFSRQEYREVFPQGTVKTPIGEVKIGKNQFEKMAEKDSGKRRCLIGAMRQTLADPIVIVPEEKDGRRAYLFIKSFKNTEDTQKPDFIMSGSSGIIVDK